MNGATFNVVGYPLFSVPSLLLLVLLPPKSYLVLIVVSQTATAWSNVSFAVLGHTERPIVGLQKATVSFDTVPW